MGRIGFLQNINQLQGSAYKLARLAALTLFAGLLAPPAGAQQATYQYDELGRLVEVDYPDGQVIKYNYDPAGNRTLVEQGGAPNPVADSVTTGEDAAKDIDVLANDTDLNGDPLSIASVGAPAHGATQKVLVGSVDWVRYTPALNYNGADSFTYTVTDGTSQATASVAVSVVAGIDPPVAGDDAASTNEDIAKTISVLTNDIDPDGDVLSIQSVGAPTHGTAVKSGADIIYTPAANYFGSDSFTYNVTDGVLSDVGLVTLTVNSVNDAPNAVDDSITINEDTAKTFDPRTNDTDAETPNTSLTITANTNGAHGTVTILTGTQLNYTPAVNYNGADSFTYTISDGTLTDTAIVNVTVTAVDDPPNAVNDSKTTSEDLAITFDPRTNDIEADGQAMTITSKTDGTHGTVTILTGTQLKYTPAANYNGADSFTYTISDGSLTDTATVSVTVNAVNDPPNAVADSYTGVNKSLWTNLMLRNNDSDIEGEAFSIISTTGSAGQIIIQSSGSYISYKCDACGSDDAFSYTIRDASGGTDSAIVTVFFSGGGGLPKF